MQKTPHQRKAPCAETIYYNSFSPLIYTDNEICFCFTYDTVELYTTTTMNMNTTISVEQDFSYCCSSGLLVVFSLLIVIIILLSLLLLYLLGMT